MRSRLKNVLGLAVVVGSLSGCESSKQNSDFLLESNGRHSISRKDLVNFLSGIANQEEFQIAYLLKKDEIVNLTLRGDIKESELDIDMLESIVSSGEEFYLIHNHNDIDLDSKMTEMDKLYWLAPSLKDIWQYLNIGVRAPQMTYGIITKFGLLTMSTEEETFNHIYNPYFGRSIEQEASRLQTSLQGVSIDSLEDWADNYKGLFYLSFEKSDVKEN